MAVMPLSMIASSERLVGCEMEVSKNHLVRPKESPLSRLGLLDLDDELGLGPDFGGVAHDRGAASPL